MGAWGSGPFENDDALDFVGDLANVAASERPNLVRAALVLPGDYVEIPEASVAVAAAALIAAAKGMPLTASAEITELLQSNTIPHDRQNCEQAQAALARVNADNSEWRQLWEESESFPEAIDSLDHISRYLAPDLV